MPASIVEQILARAEAALTGVTSAGVFRSRETPFAQDELPAIALRRGTSDTEAHARNLNRNAIVFEIELHVQGENWETDADALHVEVDTILDSDSGLAALGRGLRCMSTEASGAAAEFVSGKIVARYQLQALTRPGDLTRSIT